jgi:hypothetical protein
MLLFECYSRRRSRASGVTLFFLCRPTSHEVNAESDLAALKIVFNFVLGPPFPGEDPDCHFPKGIGGLGPILARIRG